MSNDTRTKPPTTDTRPSITERAAAVAHEGIDRAASQATRAEQRIRDSSASVNTQLRGSARRATRQGSASLHRLETLVDEHPYTALGIAFGIGVAAALCLRK